MSRSPDPMTRITRDAANAAAAVVILFAGLWFVTTQVRAIRDVSPFGEDPWDAVATYAVIALPFVAGATWVRSLRHRGPVLPVRTAARIRWGSILAVAISLAAAAADASAIATTGWRSDAGAAAGFITAFVGIVIVAAVVALALLARAARSSASVSTDPPSRTSSTMDWRWRPTSPIWSGSNARSGGSPERSSASSTNRHGAHAATGSPSAWSSPSPAAPGSRCGTSSGRVRHPRWSCRSRSPCSVPLACWPPTSERSSRSASSVRLTGEPFGSRPWAPAPLSRATPRRPSSGAGRTGRTPG